jgi:hypothetical protein
MSVRGIPCETCGLRSLLDSLVSAASRCPHWLSADAGLVETNSLTGETRLVEGCAVIENFRLMGAVIAASNRPAAAVESLRDETVGLLGRIEGQVPAAVERTILALAGGYRPAELAAGSDDVHG